MARETQKEKIARLETELAQAINQRDAAIADALASNSKLNAKHDVSDSPMYQSLLQDRDQWKMIAKNRQDQIRKAGFHAHGLQLCTCEGVTPAAVRRVMQPSKIGHQRPDRWQMRPANNLGLVDFF